MNSEAILSLGQIGSSSMELMMTYAVCSIRIMAVFLVIPPTSDDVLQGVVRNGVVLLFGSFVAIGQASVLKGMSAGMLVAIAGKELLIGISLGFLAGTVFWVAENVGLMIDDLAGYNNVQVSNPQRNDSSTLTSALLSQLVIASFWVLGGMTFLLGTIYQSFNWMPLASFSPVPGNILESFVLHQTDTLMQTSVKIATPMMLILVLIDLAFGFVAKGAEKLEPMELSQPVKGVVTVLMLAVFAGVFVDGVRKELSLSDLTARFHTFAQSSTPDVTTGKR